VALIDKHSPLQVQGSHHSEMRIIRHAYGEGEKYVPLAIKASELWDELGKSSGERVFEKTGVLNVGTKNSSFLNNVKASAQRFSLPVTELTAQEINTTWKSFSLDNRLMGCFEKNSGGLLSEKAVKTFRQLAYQDGTQFYFNDIVKMVSIKKSLIEVSLEQKKITGDKLLITAGKGTNQILSLLGYELPVTPFRKPFSWFNTDEDIYSSSVFPAWTFDDTQTYYGFPSIKNAGVK